MSSFKSFQLLAVLFHAVFALVATSCAQRMPSSESLENLQKIAKAYEIEIVAVEPTFPVRTTHGVINGKVADGKNMTRYANLFVLEFTLYPVDFVKRSQLKRIVFCDDLSFAGQRRNAIPDFEHDTLYLDVSRGAHSKSYQRKVIHHEYFHLVDFRDDGLVYKDVRWASLNPAGFRYGKGGRSVQGDARTSVLTNDFPGFLNHYSTTGVEEDKAELFANLVVDPKHVARAAKHDSVLDKKVRRMKNLLTTFCPAMNNAFWEKVRRTNRVDE